MKRALTILAIASFLLSCQSADDESLSRMGEQLDKLAEQTQELVTEYAPRSKEVTKSTQEEIEKLYNFEYMILRFEIDAPAEEIQAKLASAGADRWDCFDSDRTSSELRFYCKRHPKTVLRYIPRWFP